MSGCAQRELFEAPAPAHTATASAEEWKIFSPASGSPIRYGKEDKFIFPVDFGNGEIANARRYPKKAGSDQYRVVHPLCGVVFSRYPSRTSFLAAVAAARNYREAKAKAELAEIAATHARQREREAGERLAEAAIESVRSPEGRAHAAKQRAAPVMPSGERHYFNPFRVDWRSTKEFFQVPEWVTRTPLTPFQQIVYARLLFPLAGEHGFCERFDKDHGVVFRLNCRSLAKHLGKKESDTTERALRALAAGASPCIELHGSQGQEKTLRYLRNPWMSEAWLAVCDASDKKSDAPQTTTDRTAEVPPTTSAKKSEVPALKTNPAKKPLNESTHRAPSHLASQSTRPEAKNRATCRGDDSAKRAAGEYAQDEYAVDDEVWSDLCQTLGLLEMHRSGDWWLTRFKLSRRALALALGDWKEKTPAERAEGGGNAAAFIRTMLEHHNRTPAK